MNQPFNFNRKNISSLNESFHQVLNERKMTAQRALSIQRNAEKNARKAEKRELQTRLDQEMRNLSTSPTSEFDPSDQNALRAAAINNLQKDKDFVKRANAIGLTVGKHTGGGSAGSFGYRHSTDAEAIDARNRSREQLFDREGNARMPDFQNKRWNEAEGKWEIPMVGTGTRATATQGAAEELAKSGGPKSYNSDIAAARAASAAQRGDVGFGRRVNPELGTVDDTERFVELQRKQQERQAARDASAREEQLTRPESAATQYGRMAQRMGAGALRPPRSQYEAEQQAGARADLERAYDEAQSQGRRLGYEDQATLYGGFQRRGYQQPMFGGAPSDAEYAAQQRYNKAKEDRERQSAERRVPYRDPNTGQTRMMTSAELDVEYNKTR